MDNVVNSNLFYGRFKLNGIKPELYELIKAQQKARGADEDEFYDRVEYNDLVVDGVEVAYKDAPIDGLGFQHRQALRLLINKKGKLCFKDEFTNPEAGIFNSSPRDHALRNLIYEIRKALRAVVGQNCIISTPGEGWSLKLEP